MNEALATSFGNGMISRLLKSNDKWVKYRDKKNSFYNNYYIDKSAKVLLPILDESLAKGKTIYSSDFIDDYLRALDVAFGDELLAPKIILKEMNLLADSQYDGDFTKVVVDSLQTSSVYGSEGKWSDKRFLQGYNKRKNKNTLLIIHPKNFSKIKKNKLLASKVLREIKKSYKENNEVTYSYVFEPSTVFYVIAAKDYNSAIKLIKKFSKVKKGFVGSL